MNFHSRLVRQAQSAGVLLPLAILFGFLAGGLAILQAYRLSQVINGVFITHQTLQQVVPLLRTILLIVLARVSFTILNDVIAGRLAVWIKTRLRKLIFEKIERLGSAYMKGEKTGEITTVAMQGVEALDAYFSQYLPQVLLAVMLPVTILLVVFPMDVLTGVVFLVTAPLIPLFMVLIGWMSESQTKKQWKALSRLGDFLLDTLQGITVLKSLGRSKDRAVELEGASNQYRLTTLAVLRFTFLSALVLELIATISTAVVAVEIGLRLLYSRIAFEQVFFILLIAPDFYIPLRNLSARYHAGMTGVTAARRIFELLDTPEPRVPVTIRKAGSTPPMYGDFLIRLKNVSYSYPDSQVESLSNVSLEIQSGKHYAIVGKSGSGKTTLAKLILRLVSPQSGSIEINGEDVLSWTEEEWRSSAAWVPQSPFIFNSTLFENVTLGESAFTRQAVESAVIAAGLAEVIEQLPLGLDTPLMEGGSRLSGGEAQRVAIARAFLRNPALLLLDEPTAHLDVRLEQALTQSIRELMQNRTTITIAHRYSTILAADEVILLEGGKVLDIGPHGNLLKRCPAYPPLLSGQKERA